jgi:D-3-phosphoglycerate dehydrogenase / 2-oxoglutarate reductase
MLKVLANDGLDRKGVKILEKNGFEVDLEYKNEDELIQVIGDYDALIVRSNTQVTKEVIEIGSPPNGNLKIVVRAGIGTDNIDKDTSGCHGVVVKNAPSGNVNAAAELTLGLMFAVSRHISLADRQILNGQWLKKDLKGRELFGKTHGIYGCGQIGQRVSEFTSPLMSVIGYDIDSEAARLNYPNSRIQYQESLDDFLRKADYISIHVSGTDPVLGPNEFPKLKDGVILINVARGQSIDKQELCKALTSGKVFGAAIDVHENEPGHGGQFICPTAQFSNCILTPHIGASTVEAQSNVAIETAQVLSRYLLNGSFGNAVNCKEKGFTYSKGDTEALFFVFHKDAPGIFSEITTKMAELHVNMQDTITSPFTCNNGSENKAITAFTVSKKDFNPNVLQEFEKLENIYWARAV